MLHFFLFQILSTESIANDMEQMIKEVNTVVQLPPTTVRMMVHLYQSYLAKRVKFCQNKLKLNQIFLMKDQCTKILLAEQIFYSEIELNEMERSF